MIVKNTNKNAWIFSRLILAMVLIKCITRFVIKSDFFLFRVVIWTFLGVRWKVLFCFGDIARGHFQTVCVSDFCILEISRAVCGRPRPCTFSHFFSRVVQTEDIICFQIGGNWEKGKKKFLEGLSLFTNYDIFFEVEMVLEKKIWPVWPFPLHFQTIF